MVVNIMANMIYFQGMAIDKSSSAVNSGNALNALFVDQDLSTRDGVVGVDGSDRQGKPSAVDP